MKQTALFAAIAAICIATSTTSFAVALDLAGVDRTVTDVADLASYDEGVTNSSSTLATLTLVASDGTTIADTGKWHYRLSKDGKTLKFGPYRGLMILVR